MYNEQVTRAWNSNCARTDAHANGDYTPPPHTVVDQLYTITIISA